MFASSLFCYYSRFVVYNRLGISLVQESNMLLISLCWMILALTKFGSLQFEYRKTNDAFLLTLKVDI